MDNSIPKRRVVIIDDNRGFRLAAEAFLRTLGGVEVAGTAPDGEQGLELISRLQPDAAILDVNMPGMNGFEVAAELRKRAQAPGIILISLNVDQATRTEAHRLGVDAVLPKADFVCDLPVMLEGIFVKRRAHGDE